MFEGKQIALTRVGDREISTVELPRFPGSPVRFETCIFYDHAPSQVVALYLSEAEAQRQHNWLVEHEQNHLRLSKRMQELDPKSKSRSL